MGEISKEELNAMLEVYAKSAAHMERIASSLAIIAESQKEIVQKITNDIVVDMKQFMEKNCGACMSLTKMMKDTSDLINITTLSSNKNIDTIKNDVFWVKIIIGSAGLITSLVLMVLQILGHNKGP